MRAAIFKFIYTGSHHFLISLQPYIPRSSLDRPLPCTHEPVSVNLFSFLSPPPLPSLWYWTILKPLKLFLWFLCLVFPSFVPTSLNSYSLIFLHLPLNVGLAQCFVLYHHSLLLGDLILFLGINYQLCPDDS